MRSPDDEKFPCSVDDLVADLTEIADICAEKGFCIAYENRCWATQTWTWKMVWEVVMKADRDNVGLCLDTFEIAGGEFGDPTTETGLIGGINRAELQSRWRTSLQELTAMVPPSKIYVIQLSDAYKMNPPIEGSRNSTGQRPRFTWSNSYRPLPFDGGYLPVHDVLGAILKTNFRGWLSIETS